MAESSQRRARSPLSHGIPTGIEGSVEKQTIPHFLTTPSDTVQEDSANTMWSTYMKQAIEYDRSITDGWREDAKGFLVFVSASLLVQCGCRTDNVERPAYSLLSLPSFS